MKALLIIVLSLLSMAAIHKPTSYMLLCRNLTGGEYVQYDVAGDNVPFCKFKNAIMSAQTLGNYYWYSQKDEALKNYQLNQSTCTGDTVKATAVNEQGEALSMQLCVFTPSKMGDDAKTHYYPMIELGTLEKTSLHPDNKALNEALLENFP